jgi:thiamine biosynthesis protein ThiS
MTVESLLKACNLIYPALVVSVNGQVVPDQDIASHVVDDDDKVKVRHLVAGG